MAPANPLERIVEAISDGAPVEWEGAAAEVTTPADRARLAELRVLENIARFHRPDLDDTCTLVPTAAPGAAHGTWGGLELRSILGSGGFGRVYQGWDPKLEREVAVKLVETARFPGTSAGDYLREGRLLARVRHPNVAQVYGADVRDGFAGIWMELIHGRTLEASLKEQGTLGASEAARIGIEVCRGLAAVHAAGLIHRDVKTSNVMRERGGRIVLMDLGAGFDVVTEGTRAGETTGTPFYMAPEVLSGEPASARSDVYSLGIVLFRLVSARYPIDAHSLNELLEAHRAGRRRSLRDLRPDLPPDFIRVIDASIAVDPAQRHASAGELQAALEAFVAAAPAPAHRVSRRWVPGLAAVAILATATAVSMWTRHAASGPLQVEATIYRTNERGREPLRDGDAIAAGDRLSMDIDASTQAHVYVLNQDDSGAIFLLFPLAGVVPGNPLPPGHDHRLPGTLDGRPQAWVASSGGGTERFLIVASQEPLTEIEADLAALQRPTAAAGMLYAKLSPASERRLRSMSGLIDDDARESASLFERVERLGDTGTHSSAVWIRHIRLRSD